MATRDVPRTPTDFSWAWVLSRYRGRSHGCGPATALIMASISLLAMVYYKRLVFSLFVAMLTLSWLYFRFTPSLRAQAVADPLLNSIKLPTIFRSAVDPGSGRDRGNA